MPRRDFRAVAEQLPTVVWETDPRGACTFINARWTELTGQSTADAMGLGWRSCIDPDDLALVDTAARDAWTHGVPLDLEVRLKALSGKARWVRLVASADVRGEALLGFVGLVLDVTAARQAVAELGERESQLRLLEARNHALLENLHRAQLNPLEEASAYQQLLADFGITQEQLATRIGRSRPQISNTIRLLKLPEPVQARVAAGVLSAGHARAILSLDGETGSAEAMQRLADKIVNEGLSVRAAEAAAGELPKPGKGKKPRPGGVQAQLDAIAERLGNRFDTRVHVKLGAKKGQVTIDFATNADLKRILDELGDPGFN